MRHFKPSTYILKVYHAGRKDRTVVTKDNLEIQHVKSNEVGAKQFNVVKTFIIIKKLPIIYSINHYG